MRFPVLPHPPLAKGIWARLALLYKNTAKPIFTRCTTLLRCLWRRPFLAALRRLAKRFARWWWSRSVVQQDRWANFAPMLAVLLFLIVVLVSFAYLQSEDRIQRTDTVQRDREYVVQRINLRLREYATKVAGIWVAAKDKGIHSLATEQQARVLFADYPEIVSVSWVNRDGIIIRHHAAYGLSRSVLQGVGKRLPQAESRAAFIASQNILYPVYTSPIIDKHLGSSLQMHYPLVEKEKADGALVVEYTVAGFLRYALPSEVAARYAISAYYHPENPHKKQEQNAKNSSANAARNKEEALGSDAPLLEQQPVFLAGAVLAAPEPWLGWIPRPDWGRGDVYMWAVPALGSEFILHAESYRDRGDLPGRLMFWLAGLLSLLTTWMLIANWRHSLRRNQAQKALLEETRFRRAMEDSMLIGIRVLDMESRTTYVNPAFCQMTGYTEAELLGGAPPFPYWPDKDIAVLQRTLEEELSSQSPHDGSPVQLRRKNTALFYARLYTSPLLDSRGKHSGWITSMTDVTEPTLFRQRLSESHERFTTVLEGLGASISVTPIGSEELLFANKQYREWFGVNSQGHGKMLYAAGLPPDLLQGDSSGNNAEIHLPDLKLWLEVRARYLSWVDGRLAQMLIATDITPRRNAEEQEAEQIQRAENVSRLMTMGEMASSVAHELNQPLTAISNYCNGLLLRIKNKSITDESLTGALEKTAKQAQRAGQIIQRIREFVKRSEPRRIRVSVETLINDSLDLANIELRRRGVQLHSQIADKLPSIEADPILIEQVLINLLKNAAESIDQAQRPMNMRTIELQVQEVLTEEGIKAVEFSVTDSGNGLDPEVEEKLYETFFSTKPQGMGMGLSLCRSIVESHQGRMRAQNIYNEDTVQGCRFAFYLPIQSLAPAAQPEQAAPLGPSAPSVQTTVQQTKPESGAGQHEK